MKNLGKIKKLILTFAVVIAGLCAAAAGYLLWEKAPRLAEETAPQETVPVSPQPKRIAASPKPEEGPKSIAFDNQRKDGVYTILLVGNDDGTGNTDTIILGKIDTENHRMDFVSIPRDTYINEPWEVRKLNGVYWNSVLDGGSGIDALERQVMRLAGYKPDCYAVIDLNAFVDAVDAMGGIYFNVPAQMDYEDSSQGLYIHLSPGYQLLDGYQCMGLCRFREGYFNGDLDRIAVQQDFLKAAAEQVISIGNIPNITKVISVLSEGMDTNLSPENIAFFMRQALKCSSEDINFYTAPCTTDVVHGYSYAFLIPNGWLEMVNSLLNPYEQQVDYGNIDIVYQSGAGYAASGVMYGESYFARPTPPPMPEPTPQPVSPPQAAPQITAAPAATPEPEPVPLPPELPGGTPVPMEDTLFPGRKISY